MEGTNARLGFSRSDSLGFACNITGSMKSQFGLR